MRIERIDGTVILLHRRNYGLGIGFFFLAGLVLLIGFLAATTGQHFPHMTSTMTGLWALGVGSLFSLLGAVFTGTHDRFEFSYRGIFATYSRWRFISWNVQFPANSLQTIYVEPENEWFYRIWIDAAQRPALEVATGLSSENAWQIASMIAEPCQLMVKAR